jgi:hypothetical protein
LYINYFVYTSLHSFCQPDQEKVIGKLIKHLMYALKIKLLIERDFPYQRENIRTHTLKPRTFPSSSGAEKSSGSWQEEEGPCVLQG